MLHMGTFCVWVPFVCAMASTQKPFLQSDVSIPPHKQTQSLVSTLSFEGYRVSKAKCGWTHLVPPFEKSQVGYCVFMLAKR